MTGATADRFRIPERGYLRPGCKADITILDEAALSVDETKPDRKPGGVAHVFINGTPVLTDGVYHGGCAGAVVLKK